MASEGFRIAGAWVEVNLQDNTEADEKRIRARLEKSGPVTLGSALDDPDNLKIVKDKIQASAPATIRTDADTALAQAKIRELAAARNAAVISIDADIAKAQARIEALEAKRGSTKLDVDAEVGKAEAKIAALQAKRNRVVLQTDVDQGSLRRASDQVESETAKMAARANAQFKALQFTVAFAGLPGAAAVAGAGVAAGLAGVPAIFAGIAAASLKSNLAVSNAWSTTGERLRNDVHGWTRPLQQEFVDAADAVSAEADKLSPQITTAMTASAASVGLLTQSVFGLAENAMPGLVIAANNSRGPLLGVQAAAAQTGRGITDFFTNLSQGAEASQGVMTEVGGTVRDFLGFAGSLFANLTNNGGPALTSFRTGLQQIEGTVLTLTSSTSPLISGVEGFITASNGALVVVNLLANALGILPPQIGQFAGSMFAASKIAGAFGVDVGAKFDGLKDKISNATGASGKLSTAVSGLAAGAFSPATLAVAGLGVGLLLLGQDQERAAQAAQVAARAQDSYTAALRESKGVIDASVRAEVAKDLAQKSSAGSGISVLDAAKQYGVALPLVTDAVTGNRDAMHQVTTQLDAYAKANPKAAETVNALKIAILAKSNVFGTSQKAIEGEAAATSSAADATGRVTAAQWAALASTANLKGAFDKLNQAGGDVVAKGQAIIAMLDQLSGKQMSAEDAVQAFNNTIRDLGKQFQQAESDGSRFTAKMLDSSGAINTTTAAGSKLQDVVQQAAANMASYGQALADAGTPADQITAKLGGMRDQLAAQLKQLGLTPPQIDAVLAHYNALPADIVTALHLEGSKQAQQEVTDLVTKLKEVPPDKGVTVKALTTEAQQALIQLGYHIVQLPNGTFQIFGNTAPGQKAADEFAARNFGRQIFMTLDANAEPANGKLTTTVQRANGSTGTVTFDARPDPATNKLQVLVQQVDGTWGWMNVDAFNDAAKARVGDAVRVANGSRGFIQVDANTGPARSSLAEFYRSITSVTIPVRTSGPPLPLPGGAIGGIVKPYASGGFFPDLTPMTALASVVPPATYRVIGDNVRVPEAYIPLDPLSQRSQAVLEKANAAMGHGGTAVVSPGIDYGALGQVMEAAMARALADVLSAGVNASFDAASLEKGLITLARRRSTR